MYAGLEWWASGLVIVVLFVLLFSWRSSLDKKEVFMAKVIACRRVLLTEVDNTFEYPAIEIIVEVYKDTQAPYQVTFTKSWAETKPQLEVGQNIQVQFFAGLPQEILLS